MNILFKKKLLLVISVLVVTVLILTFSTSHKSVDFTTEVKPVLNKNCITCHGGVRQKGGFSLLFHDQALGKTKSGQYAIIPGDPDHSEMIRRLTLNDPEDRMPYKHESLSKRDIDILRRWIKEGARWGEHWAYVPVKVVPVPQSKTFFGLITTKSDWAKNQVDNFLEEKLIERHIKPSPQADKQTLLRRVSLDIIGMPAPEKLAKNFLNNGSAHAYADLVDSLLASPHYGEKWAALWMDLARYADTKGYEKDLGRNIWKYRDWLIHAFNDDKPYDQFLAEQMAGDLMPDATDAQYIATAFHRNTMTNDEDGTDNEEFRTAAVMDRVNTTWEAVMGTTFSCVQCHSHPYDPFKQQEYYKFMAFFNNTRDEDTGDDYPLLRQFNDTLEQELLTVVNWLKQNTSSQKAKDVYVFIKTWQPSYNTLVCDSFINSYLLTSNWISFRNQAICRLKNVDLDKKNHLIFRYRGLVDGGIWQIHIDNAGGEVIANIPLNRSKNNDAWQFAETDLKPVNGTHNLYFTYTNASLEKTTDYGASLDWLYFTEHFPGKNKEGYSAIKKQFWKLLTADVPAMPIMVENPPDMHRQSYVFERGNWLVKGEKVTPDVPGSLNPFPANAPRNRLGLAMWLTSKQNPLTARTMVNRIWEQLFGTGLAETLEDLGSQGIPPTHLELLNWLSYRFMNDDNWSVKKLLRTIVMSAGYQQDSKIASELLEKDPYNKYYARGARMRLSAEQMRDQALCISGLMSDKMYGPGVYPYQPIGIWRAEYSDIVWTKSNDENQYRRALYTYWKRSAPYPSTIIFDGVSHEISTARRILTNTPLQALATLNDSAYIEMARHFAYRMQIEGGKDVTREIKRGFELSTYKAIDDKSLQSLIKLYNSAYNKFKNDADKTCKMVGEMGMHTNAETAALIVVANAILNLDEVVTKR